MSRQDRNRAVIEHDRSVQATAAELRRAVRKALPRKRDRDAAILRAITMQFPSVEAARARKGRDQ